MTPAGSKAKGSRLELSVARRLEDAGLEVSRVGYQAGMRGTAHDLRASVRGQSLAIECKARADGWVELHRWLDQADMLVCKADRKPALAVLPLETFLALVTDTTKEAAK